MGGIKSTYLEPEKKKKLFQKREVWKKCGEETKGVQPFLKPASRKKKDQRAKGGGGSGKKVYGSVVAPGALGMNFLAMGDLGGNEQTMRGWGGSQLEEKNEEHGPNSGKRSI